MFPELVKNDPWWNDPKIDPHRPSYVRQAFAAPTAPMFYVYNPAYARVETEHVWGEAMADIMANGVAPQAATNKRFAGSTRSSRNTRSIRPERDIAPLHRAAHGLSASAFCAAAGRTRRMTLSRVPG